MHSMEINDAGLVTQSHEGSRDAFRQIVERYKILICSLAYSGTGSVSQSEDLAQHAVRQGKSMVQLVTARGIEKAYRNLAETKSPSYHPPPRAL